MKTQHKGFCTLNLWVTDPVGMYGYEKVGLCLICYLGPFIKGHEDVSVAGVNQVEVGHLFLEIFTDLKRHRQYYVLLLCSLAQCSGVLAAVSRVQHHRSETPPALLLCSGIRYRTNAYQKYSAQICQA